MKKASVYFLFILINFITYGSDYYWVGNNGNWSDFTNHWATSSGGGVFHTQAPTAADNVFIDANSFTLTGQTITMDVDGLCLDLDFNGVTNSAAISTVGFNLTASGDVTLSNAFDFSGFSDTLYLDGLKAGAIHSFDSDGANTSNMFLVASLSTDTDQYQLINNDLDVYLLGVISGGFSFNTQDVTCDFINANISPLGLTRFIDFSGQTATVTYSSNTNNATHTTIDFRSNTGELTILNSATSNISLTGANRRINTQFGAYTIDIPNIEISDARDVYFYTLAGSDNSELITTGDISYTRAAGGNFRFDSGNNGIRKSIGSLTFADNHTFNMRVPAGSNFGTLNSEVRGNMSFGTDADGRIIGNYLEFGGDVIFGNNSEFRFNNVVQINGELEINNTSGNDIEFRSRAYINNVTINGTAEIKARNIFQVMDSLEISNSSTVYFNHSNNNTNIDIDGPTMIGTGVDFTLGNGTNNVLWDFNGAVEIGTGSNITVDNGTDLTTFNKLTVKGTSTITNNSNLTFADSVKTLATGILTLVNNAATVTSNGVFYNNTNSVLNIGNSVTGDFTFNGGFNTQGGNTINVNTGTSTTTLSEINVFGATRFNIVTDINLTGQIDVLDANLIIDNTSTPVIGITGNINLSGSSNLNLGNGKNGTITATTGTLSLDGTSTASIDASTSVITLNNVSLADSTVLSTSTNAINVISGTLSSTASSCDMGATINSRSTGVQATLSLNTGNYSIPGLYIQDINISSGSIDVLGGRDLGNNNLTNISFSNGIAPLFWVGGMTSNTNTGIASTGVNDNWTNPDNWSIYSGTYTGSNVCIPNYNTDVTIDDASFDGGSTTISLDANGNVLSFNASSNDGIFSLVDGGGTVLSVRRNLILDDQMILAGFTGTMELTGDASSGSFTFDPQGTSLVNGDLLINTTDPSDSYVLSNAFTVDNFLLQSGNFNLSASNISVGTLDLDYSGDATRSLDFSGQTVTVRGSGATEIIDFESAGGNLTLSNSTTSSIIITSTGQTVLRLGSNTIEVPSFEFPNSTNVDITTAGAGVNFNTITFNGLDFQAPSATIDIDNGTIGTRKNFGNINIANNSIFNIYSPAGTAFGTLSSRVSNLTIGSGTNGTIAGNFIEIGGVTEVGANSELEFSNNVQFEDSVKLNSSTGNNFHFGGEADLESVLQLNGDATLVLEGTTTFDGVVDLASNADITFTHSTSPSITASQNWNLANNASINLGSGNTSNWTFTGLLTLNGGNSININNNAGTASFGAFDIDGNATLSVGANTDFGGAISIDNATVNFSNANTPTVTANQNWDITNSTVNIGNGNNGSWSFSAGTVDLNNGSILTADAGTSAISLFNLTQNIGTTFNTNVNATNAITNSYNASGATCSNGTSLKSTSAGVQANLALSSPSTVTGLIVQDINILTSTLTINNGINFTNNDLNNISFETPALDFYWVGGMASNTKLGTYSTGVNNNWTNPENWSLTSGTYSGTNGCIPSSGSDVFIDAASFDGVGSTLIDFDVSSSLSNLDASGNDDNFSFNDAGGVVLTIEGNTVLSNQMDLSGFSGQFNLNAEVTGTSFTFDNGGADLSTADLLVNATTSSDDILLSNNALTVNNFILQAGDFFLNGISLTANSIDLDSTSDNLRSFDFNGQTVTITGSGTSPVVDFESALNNLTLNNTTGSELEFTGSGQVVLELGDDAITVPTLDFQTPTNIDITTANVATNATEMRFQGIIVGTNNSSITIDSMNEGVSKRYDNITISDSTEYNLYHPDGTGFNTNSSYVVNSFALGSFTDGFISGDYFSFLEDVVTGTNTELEINDRVEFEDTVTFNSTTGNHILFNRSAFFREEVNFNGASTIQLNEDPDFEDNVVLLGTANVQFNHGTSNDPTVDCQGNWFLNDGASVNFGDGNNGRWNMNGNITINGNNNFNLSGGTRPSYLNAKLLNYGLNNNYDFNSDLFFQDSVIFYKHSNVAMGANASGHDLRFNAPVFVEDSVTLNLGNGQAGDWRLNAGAPFVAGRACNLTFHSSSDRFYFNGDFTAGAFDSLYFSHQSRTRFVGNFNLETANCEGSVLMQSTSPGTQANIEFVTYAETEYNVYVRDIRRRNNVLTIINGSNIFNNTSITFNNESVPLYWVGGQTDAVAANKSGTFSTGNNSNWSNPDNWSIADNSYSGLNTCVPTINDTTYFTTNSFSLGANQVIVDVNSASGALFFNSPSHTPTLSVANTRTLSVGGDVLFDPNMNVAIDGVLEVTGETGTGPFGITSAGNQIDGTLLIDATAQEYDLNDNLTVSTEIQLEDGTIDFNGQTVTTDKLNANIDRSNTREINLNASTLNITGGGTYTTGNEQIVIDFYDNLLGNFTLSGAAGSVWNFTGNVPDIKLLLGGTPKTIPTMNFVGTTDDILIYTRENRDCLGNLITLGDITVSNAGADLFIDNNEDYGGTSGNRGNRKIIGNVTIPNNSDFKIFFTNDNSCSSGGALTDYDQANESTLASLTVGNNTFGQIWGKYVDVLGTMDFGTNTNFEFRHEVKLNSDINIGSTTAPHFVFADTVLHTAGTMNLGNTATVVLNQSSVLNNVNVAAGSNVNILSDRDTTFTINGDLTLGLGTTFLLGDRNCRWIVNGNFTAAEGVNFESNQGNDSLTFNGNVTFTKNSVWVLSQSGYTFINGIYTANGSCTEYFTMKSTATGNDVRFYLADSTYLTGAIVVDIDNQAEDLVISNGQDGGGNGGPNPITFVAAGGNSDFYWIGGINGIGAGNNLWSDANNWSLTDGVDDGNVCTPGLTDNVYFTAASFDGTAGLLSVELDISNVSMEIWDMSSIDENIILDDTTNSENSILYVLGDFTLSNLVTNEYEGTFQFENTGNGDANKNTITSAGVTFFGPVRFDKQTTTQWQLNGDIDINGGERGDLIIEKGRLDPAGYDIYLEDDLLLIDGNARLNWTTVETNVPYTITFDGPSSNPTNQLVQINRNDMDYIQIYDIIIDREASGLTDSNTIYFIRGNDGEAGGTYDLDGDLTILNGNIELDNDFRINGSATSVLTMNSGTYMTLTGPDNAGGGACFPTGYTTANIAFDDSSTVRYVKVRRDNGQAEGMQDISSTPVYGNLYLGGMETKTVSGGPLSMTGSIVIEENVTLDDGGNQITINADNLDNDSLYVGDNVRIVIGDDAGNTTFPGNSTNGGFNSITLSNTLGGETIIRYDGNGDQDIDPLSITTGIPVLQLRNNGNKSLTGDINILTLLSVEDTATLDNSASHTINFLTGNGNSDLEFESLSGYTSGNGKLHFNGTDHYIDDNSGSAAVNEIEVNCANYLDLRSNFEVETTLEFINGHVETNNNHIYVSSTATNAITGFDDTKFVYGTLRRAIGTDQNVYIAPVADGTATTNYKRVDFVNNNLVGTNYIDFSVQEILESGNNTDARFASANLESNEIALDRIVSEAEWSLVPDNNPSSGTYGVRLYLENLTEVDASMDNAFTIVKRPDGSNNYADFNFGTSDADTSMPDTSMAGRIYDSGNGYAERFDFSSFTKFMIAYNAPLVPLPVTIVHFDAVRSEGYDNVTWSTSDETNSSYFVLQYSYDLVIWEDAEYINSSGESNSLLHYEVEVDVAGLNKVYYRLKEVSLDGIEEIVSQIVVVESEVSPLTIINLYPNPVENGDELTVQFQSQEDVEISIYSIEGALLHIEQYETYEEHMSYLTLGIDDFPTGTYILKVNNTMASQSMIFNIQ